MTLPTEVIIHIAGILERLGITYHVGGSFASSAHGMYRASADVDIVIDAGLEQLEDLARALEPLFYVSRPAIAEAHARPGTFNAIHGATSFKVDFFIKGPAPFDSEELRRSIRLPIGVDGARSILIKSAEDTILRKLHWYRRGGGISERQWTDVLSVLTAMKGQLDAAHLDRWAPELGVADLLARARREIADL